MRCYGKGEHDVQTVQVKASLIPLDWIVENKKSGGHRLLSLYNILGIIDDEELYTTPFIEALKALALIHNKEAFNYCFLPFLLQIIVCNVYFSMYAL